MWSNRQKTADLVTFTAEILNGKLHFLCSVYHKRYGNFMSQQPFMKIMFPLDILHYYFCNNFWIKFFQNN